MSRELPRPVERARVWYWQRRWLWSAFVGVDPERAVMYADRIAASPCSPDRERERRERIRTVASETRP